MKILTKGLVILGCLHPLYILIIATIVFISNILNDQSVWWGVAVDKTGFLTDSLDLGLVETLVGIVFIHVLMVVASVISIIFTKHAPKKGGIVLISVAILSYLLLGFSWSYLFLAAAGVILLCSNLTKVSGN